MAETYNDFCCLPQSRRGRSATRPLLFTWVLPRPLSHPGGRPEGCAVAHDVVTEPIDTGRRWCRARQQLRAWASTSMKRSGKASLPAGSHNGLFPQRWLRGGLVRHEGFTSHRRVAFNRQQTPGCGSALPDDRLELPGPADPLGAGACHAERAWLKPGRLRFLP